MRKQAEYCRVRVWWGAESVSKSRVRVNPACLGIHIPNPNPHHSQSNTFFARHIKKSCKSRVRVRVRVINHQVLPISSILLKLALFENLRDQTGAPHHFYIHFIVQGGVYMEFCVW